MGRRSALLRLAFSGGLAALGATPACKSGSPPGPWYDTTLDRDTSYLPMGSTPYNIVSLSYTTQEGPATADGYLPAVKNAPAVFFLPGAACVKERYYWLGTLLASHGFAVFVAEPAGTFSFSDHTTALVAEVKSEMGSASSPLNGIVDLGRIVLAGHSEGSVVQAALTDVEHCPEGLCSTGDVLPDGVRGLMLLGFNFQVTPTDPAPIPAGEIPWLLLSGSREAQVEQGLTELTYGRIVDRPLYKVEVEGMNHYQFTDYVDPSVDAIASDPTPTIGNQQARATAGTYAVAYMEELFGSTPVPADLGAREDERVKLEMKSPVLTHADTTGLPRVLRDQIGDDGFGNPGNCDVAATAEYNGALYMLLRNEVQGSEVWRLSNGALEQVLFPNGATNGIYGNTQINSDLGAMAVFQGKLYVGFSSGLEGLTRASTGAEVWSYDGISWAPIVANRATDPSVTVGALSGCDGSGSTGTMTVTGASWTPDELQGGVLDDINANTGNALVLEIVSNTADTLTFTSTEEGVTSSPISLDCSALPLPTGTRALVAGDTLWMRRGLDHNGFGQSWNKAITTMAVYNDELYIGAGLNYPYGAEIYVTSDGTTFQVAVPRADLGTAVSGQASVSSSIIAMDVSSLDGTSKLYFSANGNNGYGARLLSYDAQGTLTPLIDNASGLTGLASGGLGLGIFHLTSLVDFNERIWIGSFSGNGLQIFSASRLGADNDLRVEVGGGAPLGVGFGDTEQVSTSMDLLDGQLWVGTLAGLSDASGLNAESALSWRTPDGTNWQLVSSHGFGDNAVSTTTIAELADVRYALVGNGSLTEHECFAPLRMYTLREEATP